MISTLAERLKEAMKGPPKITGVTLAKACGVKPASVSDWLTGKSKTMEGSNLMAAAKLLKVDPDWLATGKGLKKSGQLAMSESPIYNTENPELITAIEMLRRLPPDVLMETVSFMKWKLASKEPPRDGQALPVAA